MPSLWLIRHAPAAGNVGGVFMGQVDAPPEAAGIATAAGLAGTIAADRVWASPLQRAARTAEALFPQRGVVLDDRLMERHLGAWQGRAKDEVRAEQPAAFTAAGTLDLTVTPPGGESFADLQARVAAVLRDVGGVPEGEVVALVAHNGVLRTARVLLGLLDVAAASATPERFAQPDRVEVPRDRLLGAGR